MSCGIFCSDLTRPYYVFDSGITGGADNCFCYDTCEPPQYVNSSSSTVATTVGSYAECPVLPSQVCIAAPGWRCGVPKGQFEFDLGYPPSVECPAYCQTLDVDFIYYTYYTWELSPTGWHCDCFSKDTCSSLTYDQSSTSGAVQYAYPNATACPLIAVNGTTLLGNNLICTPETAIYPAARRRKRNLANTAPNFSPQDCFNFCWTAGITHFNFYPDFAGHTVCSCSDSCATTQAAFGALRYNITSPPPATDAPSQAPSVAPSHSPSSSPSSSPSTLSPSSPPTALPSQQPSTTVAPSSLSTGLPSYSPSLTPSSFPTGLPSAGPTPSATAFPTFAPQPPTDPVQAVAKNKVCGPEVSLTTQSRLAEKEEDVATTASSELEVWTPNSCASACAARLGAPPTFVINIYSNETSGEQICTCCLACTTWRDVPGAQVFAACAAGDEGNSLVQFQAKLSRAKKGVKPGKLVRYAAQVKNMGKVVVVGGLALTVQLPAGVSLLKSKTTGNFVAVARKRRDTKARYRSDAPLHAVLNTTTVPASITWQDLFLPPRKLITFLFMARVAPNVDPSTRLTFRTLLYQRLPANGLPYCASSSVNQSVVVVTDGKVE